MKTFTQYIGVVFLTVMLGACVSVKNPHPDDPLENYNRTMFAINEGVDKAVFRPVALGYKAVVPSPVRTCIGNIFGNVGDIWSGINSLLQGRGLDFVNTLGRVLFNSTMGLGGCIDVATMNGAYKIPNDFGTTLGVWGVGEGAPVVLPILGASSWRDGIGLLGDAAGGTVTGATPWAITHIPLRNSVVGLQAVNKRYQLLTADDIASDVAIDKYTFVRDAYKQNRQALLRAKLEDEIKDGTPATAHLAIETLENGNVVAGQARREAYRLKLREKRHKRLAEFDTLYTSEYDDPGE